MPVSLERLNDADNAGTHAHDAQPESERLGDFRGRYGYGRPAHGTDPDARYGFAVKLLEARRPR